MTGQLHAMAKLLSDGDIETVQLVKEQLLLAGGENLEGLRLLAAQHDLPVSRHAQEILLCILRQEAEEDFELTCRFFCDSCDLEPVLWQMAAALQPEADLARCRRMIEQWGRRFAVRAQKAISSRERVLALAEFMAGELCFRGNSNDYYHPSNSLLPAVIESRTGLPITLTLLYRMVALRAGMIVDGLNTPGHFLARHEDVIFDPFHKGKILSRKEVEALVARQGSHLKPHHLLPAPPRIILARVLANLAFAFELRGAKDSQKKVEVWLELLRT